MRDVRVMKHKYMLRFGGVGDFLVGVGVDHLGQGPGIPGLFPLKVPPSRVKKWTFWYVIMRLSSQETLRVTITFLHMNRIESGAGVPVSVRGHNRQGLYSLTVP